jgi:hypothetical protein
MIRLIIPKLISSGGSEPFDDDDGDDDDDDDFGRLAARYDIARRLLAVVCSASLESCCILTNYIRTPPTVTE